MAARMTEEENAKGDYKDPGTKRIATNSTPGLSSVWLEEQWHKVSSTFSCGEAWGISLLPKHMSGEKTDGVGFWYPSHG